MTSASHLLTEDRPDFERLLDTALHGAEYAVGAGRGRPLNPEQLRTMALSAMAAISACAAAEYDRYVRLRTEFRRPSEAGGSAGAGRGGGAGGAKGGGSLTSAGGSSGSDSAGSAGASGSSGSSGSGLGGPEGVRFAGAMGQIEGSSSAGVAAAAAVLVPVLAGTAAVIFLAVGYLLHMMNPEPSVASSMRQAGWIFAVLAVAAIVISMIALLLTAVRNGATSIRAAASRELADEVDRAREEWREALLERGIRPFLEEALAGGGAADGTYPAVRTDPGVSRTPRLGYSRPAFSSPDDGPSAADGPGYSSPDFTSPDYGGPEHDPD